MANCNTTKSPGTCKRVTDTYTILDEETNKEDQVVQVGLQCFDKSKKYVTSSHGFEWDFNREIKYFSLNKAGNKSKRLFDKKPSPTTPAPVG